MEPTILGRLHIWGDTHANSKNYGGHINYPKESLFYFKAATDLAIERNANCIIGTGDLTFGRFHSLEYRKLFEEQLMRQNEQTKGNRFEVKGNHDSATYGMTEHEYYIDKGILKPSKNIRIGNVNISMIDYGKHDEVEILPVSEDTINVAIAHDYYRFKESPLPNYGKNSIILDNYEKFFGIDYLICGHIHSYHIFDGIVIKQGMAHNMVVTYLGCMTRPAYREDHMDEVGKVIELTIYSDGTMRYEELEIPLWDLDKSFNLSQKIIDRNDKTRHVDISDIVTNINEHKRVVGDPEEIIMSMENKDVRYRQKAIELLKEAQG